MEGRGEGLLCRHSARENFDVPQRGWVSADIIDAFDIAH